jgi:DNA ligase-1
MDFLRLAQYFEKLEATSKRLEKVTLLTALFEETPEEDFEQVLFLLEGRVFPVWRPEKLGLASQMILKSISSAYGTNNISDLFKEHGDIGLVAQAAAKTKTQTTLFFTQEKISVQKVFSNLQKIAKSEGENSSDAKQKLLAQLLTSSSPVEAKFVARIAIGDTRIGVALGTLRDSLVQYIFPRIAGLQNKKELTEGSFEGNVLKVEDLFSLKNQSLMEYDVIVCSSYEMAREVYNLILSAFQSGYERLNEITKVASIAKGEGLKGLQNITLEVLTPIRLMLMQKVSTVEEATKKIPLPFVVEQKYDGFRVQLHKKGKEVHLYTRNIEDVTAQFPDVVEQVLSSVKADEVVLDGEVLGLAKDGSFVPFQQISQRIKRKHDIASLVKSLPVVYVTWDVLYLNGKSLINEKHTTRRETLASIISPDARLRLSEYKMVNSVESAEVFYKQSLDMGNEGIVIKDPDAIYKPGNRVGCWLKLKPIMDPLDVVIVGAEWGEGKRSKWLTSFLVAIKDGDSFKTIGKVGTGIKELEQDDGITFEQLTFMLQPSIISEKNQTVTVAPKVVIAVAYEEIQKSPTYTSGFALRFPRFLSLREDLDLQEVDDLRKVTDYFNQQ